MTALKCLSFPFYISKWEIQRINYPFKRVDSILQSWKMIHWFINLRRPRHVFQSTPVILFSFFLWRLPSFSSVNDNFLFSGTRFACCMKVIAWMYCSFFYEMFCTHTNLCDCTVFLKCFRHLQCCIIQVPKTLPKHKLTATHVLIILKYITYYNYYSEKRNQKKIYLCCIGMTVEDCDFHW